MDLILLKDILWRCCRVWLSFDAERRISTMIDVSAASELLLQRNPDQHASTAARQQNLSVHRVGRSFHPDACLRVCAGGDASSQLASLLAADPSLKDRLPPGTLAALGPMGKRKAATLMP